LVCGDAEKRALLARPYSRESKVSSHAGVSKLVSLIMIDDWRVETQKKEIYLQ
jgi:hypothetical protein